MVRGGFRHLVVVEGQEVTGLLSMRDIVRCWSPADAGATTASATRLTGPRPRPGATFLARGGQRLTPASRARCRLPCAASRITPGGRR